MIPMEMEETVREEEFVGLGCALEFFKELDEVLEMLNQLKFIYNDETKAELAYQRFHCILTLYQEQPHLLDRHLDTILQKVIEIVRNQNEPVELKHKAFKYLHVIVKVRGFKVVVRHLPHEVSDMEPVLLMLEQQDPLDVTTWEINYGLLLWLSIIVMIPFHMSRLDGFVAQPNADKDGVEKKSVMQRLFDICKRYVLVVDSSRYAAAYLASRFLTRGDVKEKYLEPFISFACKIVGSGDSTILQKCGCLKALASILKHGERDDLLPHAKNLLQWITTSNFRTSSELLIRQFTMKIAQRIGLIFLKMRLAAWRYERGCRSLAANLHAGDVARQQVAPAPQVALAPAPAPAPAPTKTEEIADDFDVPEEIEDVIEELIQGLRDLDTRVRWSAAKGIGRVTGRLPKELADEVVGSVLELFSSRESDSAWHGGCLALAELGKRGLLLPQRLAEVVPVVLKALLYDEARGYVTVGSHIRDAACYVCWSFARAYDTEIFRPYVKDIAEALVVVTVFDREVNCRRAASAAFQENVGRQGSFPHGIEILTEADYFAVGVRSNAFLNISVYIAQFEEYTSFLINHLVEYKVVHWDVAIRELAAKALHNLTNKAPEHIAKVVIPQLLALTTSIEINSRHGSVLALAESLHALALTARDQNNMIQELLGQDVLEKIRFLVPQFKERGQFRSVGGELLKQACCLLVCKAALAQLPFHEQPILSEWQSLLDECLAHEVSTVRSRAANSIPAFFNEYYQHSDSEEIRVQRQVVVERYTEKLCAKSETTRMGFCLAIGFLPPFMMHGRVDSVVQALIECATIKEGTLTWAESRRDAIKALHSVAAAIGLTESSCKDKLSADQVDSMFYCFLKCLSDYTKDSRGDVGAWVREAAITGLQVLTFLVVKQEPFLLRSEVVERMISDICQQAVEHIDRTRAHAGRIFSSLIHSDPMVPLIPHHAELLQIFPADLCRGKIDWRSASLTFPLFIQLLSLPAYTQSVTTGLINSIGGISESMVKHSGSALFSYIKQLQDKPEELTRLCDVIVQVIAKWIGSERSISVLTFLDRILGSGCLRSVLVDTRSSFSADILKLVKEECTLKKDVPKLMKFADVMCHLVQVSGDVSRRALTQLLILLCHRFPIVRKSTATRLYEALILYGDDAGFQEECLEKAMTLLSETDWDQAVDTVRPIRNNVCQLFGILPPVAKKVNT